MDIILPDLCDTHGDRVTVLAPLFRNFGARRAFGGPISTIKCFEDNSLVKSMVDEPGKGKVMVVDAGGSMRRACLGDMLAEKATANGWEGIIMYGCIRDVDEIAALDLGVQALGAHPMKTEKRGIGDAHITIRFGGIDFIPGQYVYADNNGVIVSAEALI